MFRTIARGTLILASLLAITAGPAVGQEGRKAVSLLAGPSQYDLGGTGTTAAVAARLDLPLGRTLLVEPGLTYLPYENQFGPRIHHVLPEAQLQLQWPGETFRPYLGAGVGASWAVRSGRDAEVDGTLSTAAGLRVPTSSGWIFRGELRVRAIDPWVGTTADWSIGVGRSF